MKKYERFTEEEIEYIKSHYAEEGRERIARTLNKEVLAISRLANRLHLKQASRNMNKALADYNVDPSQFYSITKPEVAYYLGVFWADGFFGGTNSSKYVRIEVVKDDGDIFFEIFSRIGTFSHYIRQRKNRTRKMSCITIGNKLVYNYLEEHGFKTKSSDSPTNILKKIPKSLHKYFWRGYVDGDGCFYVSKTQHTIQFALAGSYEQNWCDFMGLLKSLTLSSGKIRKTVTKKGHKSSVVKMCNKQDVWRLGEYIYDGYKEDGIGLPRKYQKWLEIKDRALGITKFSVATSNKQLSSNPSQQIEDLG